MRDPPRNPGPAVDIGGVWKSGAQLVLEEREVSAGENDGVDPVASIGVEHRLHRRTDSIDGDLVAGELRLGELDQLGRSEADERAIGRELRGEVVDTLKTLYSLNDRSGDNAADDAAKIDQLANVILPDILTFDTASSQGFLNGRRPADDVIDAELPLVTEGAVKTDCVDSNDTTFPSGFPYLAAPHQ